MTGGPDLMGIDDGTRGVGVGLFDGHASPAVGHAVEFRTAHPAPGRAEHEVGNLHGLVEEPAAPGGFWARDAGASGSHGC
jgi:glycerol kinase